MESGTVFFDYDGTIHDSNRLYAPAFRDAYAWLVKQGYAEPREFTDEWCAQCLGWTVADMWEAFMPELPDDVWHRASRKIGDDMDRLAREGHAALFPGVKGALTELKEVGFTLVFLSNCGEGYRDQGRELFGLDRWFSAYHCASQFPGLPKWEIYQQVRNLYDEPQAMVGDRYHDIEVALRGNIPSVGCAFGYGKPGELDKATVVVDSFADIPAALESL